MKKTLVVAATTLFLTITAVAAPDDVMTLPKPAKTVGVDLYVALANRASTRQFDASRSISNQALSNLLWAANGINRPDGRRTAPAPRNIQFVEIYVATAKGVYRYRPDAPGSLARVTDRDIRNALFLQSNLADAPVALLFVYDSSVKPANLPDDKVLNYVWNAAGLMEQNIGLAAAAQKIGAVVIGSIKPAVVVEALKLGADKTPLLAMPIGYPKK